MLQLLIHSAVNPSEFHARCDEYSESIVIVTNSFGNVIGGLALSHRRLRGGATAGMPTTILALSTTPQLTNSSSGLRRASKTMYINTHANTKWPLSLWWN